MNFKPLLLVLMCLLSCLTAEPVLQLHDGTAWKEIDAGAWEKLPRTELTAKSHDGKERKYSGVAVSEVLKLLSAPAGDTLRGAELTRVVLFHAKDGYQVAFSLAELDGRIRKQNAIVADRVDGQPLPESHAPRMLVVSDDLKHARWIRQLTSIALIRVELPKQ